jgi:thioredoxin reductase (NADPH)
MEDVEVAIIGGGPTGLAAGLYAARAKRRTVLWERGVLGGQIAITGVVENYPGFADGVEGPILALEMHRQAEGFGMETRYEGITRITLDGAGPLFLLESPEGQYRAQAVIVAAGADPVKLGVPGEEELTGRGVSYCATCDGAFFKDEVVAVVGGGDAAIEEALFLTRYAKQVRVIHRRDELRASMVLQERAFANERIDFTWDTVVTAIDGTERVEGIQVLHATGGERRRIEVGGVFIFIGHHPNSDLIGGLTRLDEGGHAFVNLWMETERPGLFVAGDVRVDSARQLASAVGDGVTASIRAEHYLQHQLATAAAPAVREPAREA